MSALHDPTFIGTEYNGYFPAVQISKMVREEVKAAKKTGVIPADVKVSVTSDSYAGGQAVRVSLSGWSKEQVWQQEWDQVCGWMRQTLTEDALRVLNLIEEMRNRYNWEAVNGQIDYFDVMYYGQTQWDV